MANEFSAEAQMALAGARAAILGHLPSDLILECYQRAAGTELLSGKFASPESSAALVANAFGFFLDRPELLSLPVPTLSAGAARRVTLEAEMRFPWRGGEHPWLDVGIATETAVIGIESKRYEPFRDEKVATFSDAYLRDVWGATMGPYEKMRDDLMNGKRKFTFLNAAQLVKHAFGLRTQSNKKNQRAKLVYLYAEPRKFPDGRPVIEPDITGHREEVREFSKAIAHRQSDVEFFSLTYRELLQAWANWPEPEVRMHAARILEKFDV